jgi:hypothetical protein
LRGDFSRTASSLKAKLPNRPILERSKPTFPSL